MIREPSFLPVLRFRDIEVDLGETITKHRRIIEDHDCCWWGWLSREYESNPHRELDVLHNTLISEANGESYHVVLFDTGQGKLYLASCNDIKTSRNRMYSPKVDLTPDYYRSKRAPAWFRFIQISDISADEIVGRTCHAMPSASEECFTDLLGKEVKGIKDLRRQEVTLWVLARATSA
jgi:hypothetical protein